MLFLKNNHSLLLRAIAAGIACLFLFNSIICVDDAEALAIWSAMQRIDGRRIMEVEKLERCGHIKFAMPGTDDAKQLDIANADLKIDERGVLILRPSLKKDPLALLRLIHHKKTQLLILALSGFDSPRYEAIKGLLQQENSAWTAYSVLSQNSGLPPSSQELSVRDMLASAFELIILREAQFVSHKELSSQERGFFDAVLPVIKNHPEYFSEIFRDSDARETFIRTALANGLSIADVIAPTSKDAMSEAGASIPSHDKIAPDATDLAPSKPPHRDNPQHAVFAPEGLYKLKDEAERNVSEVISKKASSVIVDSKTGQRRYATIGDPFIPVQAHVYIMAGRSWDIGKSIELPPYMDGVINTDAGALLLTAGAFYVQKEGSYDSGDIRPLDDKEVYERFGIRRVYDNEGRPFEMPMLGVGGRSMLLPISYAVAMTKMGDKMPVRRHVFGLEFKAAGTPAYKRHNVNTMFPATVVEKYKGQPGIFLDWPYNLSGQPPVGLSLRETASLENESRFESAGGMLTRKTLSVSQLNDVFHVVLRAPLGDYRRLRVFFDDNGRPKNGVFDSILSELGLTPAEYLSMLATNYGNNLRSLIDSGIMQAEHGSIINCDIFGNCADLGDFYNIAESNQRWVRASINAWVDNLAKVLKLAGPEHKDDIDRALKDFAAACLSDSEAPVHLKIDMENTNRLKNVIFQRARVHCQAHKKTPAVLVLGVSLPMMLVALPLLFLNDIIYHILREDVFYQALINKYPNIGRFLARPIVRNVLAFIEKHDLVYQEYLFPIFRAVIQLLDKLFPQPNPNIQPAYAGHVVSPNIYQMNRPRQVNTVYMADSPDTGMESGIGKMSPDDLPQSLSTGFTGHAKEISDRIFMHTSGIKDMLRAGDLEAALKEADSAAQLLEGNDSIEMLIDRETKYVIIAYNLIARECASKGDIDRAERATRQAHRLSNKYPQAQDVRDGYNYIVASYRYLVGAVRGTEKIGEWIEDFEARCAAESDDVISKVVLIYLFIETERFEEALGLARSVAAISGLNYKMLSIVKNLEAVSGIKKEMQDATTSFMVEDAWRRFLDVSAELDPRDIGRIKGYYLKRKKILVSMETEDKEAIDDIFAYTRQAQDSIRRHDPVAAMAETDKAYNILIDKPLLPKTRNKAEMIISRYVVISIEFIGARDRDGAEEALAKACKIFEEYNDARDVARQAVYIAHAYCAFIVFTDSLKQVKRLSEEFGRLISKPPIDIIARPVLALLSIKMEEFDRGKKMAQELALDDTYEPSMRHIAEELVKIAVLFESMKAASTQSELGAVDISHDRLMSANISTFQKMLLRYREKRLSEIINAENRRKRIEPAPADRMSPPPSPRQDVPAPKEPTLQVRLTAAEMRRLSRPLEVQEREEREARRRSRDEAVEPQERDKHAIDSNLRKLDEAAGRGNMREAQRLVTVLSPKLKKAAKKNPALAKKIMDAFRSAHGKLTGQGLSLDLGGVDMEKNTEGLAKTSGTGQVPEEEAVSLIDMRLAPEKWDLLTADFRDGRRSPFVMGTGSDDVREVSEFCKLSNAAYNSLATSSIKKMIRAQRPPPDGVVHIGVCKNLSTNACKIIDPRDGRVWVLYDSRFVKEMLYVPENRGRLYEAGFFYLDHWRWVSHWLIFERFHEFVHSNHIPGRLNTLDDVEKELENNLGAEHGSLKSVLEESDIVLKRRLKGLYGGEDALPETYYQRLYDLAEETWVLKNFDLYVSSEKNSMSRFVDIDEMITRRMNDYNMRVPSTAYRFPSGQFYENSAGILAVLKRDIGPMSDTTVIRLPALLQSLAHFFEFINNFGPLINRAFTLEQLESLITNAEDAIKDLETQRLAVGILHMSLDAAMSRLDLPPYLSRELAATPPARPSNRMVFLTSIDEVIIGFDILAGMIQKMCEYASTLDMPSVEGEVPTWNVAYHKLENEIRNIRFFFFITELERISRVDVLERRLAEFAFTRVQSVDVKSHPTGDHPSAIGHREEPAEDIHEHDHGIYQTHIHTTAMEKLGGIFAMTFGFAWVEFIYGIITGSIALAGDAWHMFTDSMGIGVALFAMWTNTWSRPPPRKYGGNTFYEVAAALFNGLTVVLASADIGYKGVSRLLGYTASDISYEVFLVASLGLLVNIIAMYLMHSSKDHSLNLNGAYRHIVADAAGSIAAVASGVLIWTLGAYRVDAVLGLGIGVWISYGAVILIYRSCKCIHEFIKEKGRHGHTAPRGSIYSVFQELAKSEISVTPDEIAKKLGVKTVSIMPDIRVLLYHLGLARRDAAAEGHPVFLTHEAREHSAEILQILADLHDRCGYRPRLEDIRKIEPEVTKLLFHYPTEPLYTGNHLEDLAEWSEYVNRLFSMADRLYTADINLPSRYFLRQVKDGDAKKYMPTKAVFGYLARHGASQPLQFLINIKDIGIEDPRNLQEAIVLLPEKIADLRRFFELLEQIAAEDPIFYSRLKQPDKRLGSMDKPFSDAFVMNYVTKQLFGGPEGHKNLNILREVVRRMKKGMAMIDNAAAAIDVERRSSGPVKSSPTGYGTNYDAQILVEKRVDPDRWDALTVNFGTGHDMPFSIPESSPSSIQVRRFCDLMNAVYADNDLIPERIKNLICSMRAPPDGIIHIGLSENLPSNACKAIDQRDGSVWVLFDTRFVEEILHIPTPAELLKAGMDREEWNRAAKILLSERFHEFLHTNYYPRNMKSPEDVLESLKYDLGLSSSGNESDFLGRLLSLAKGPLERESKGGRNSQDIDPAEFCRNLYSLTEEAWVIWNFDSYLYNMPDHNRRQSLIGRRMSSYNIRYPNRLDRFPSRTFYDPRVGALAMINNDSTGVRHEADKVGDDLIFLLAAFYPALNMGKPYWIEEVLARNITTELLRAVELSLKAGGAIYNMCRDSFIKSSGRLRNVSRFDLESLREALLELSSYGAFNNVFGRMAEDRLQDALRKIEIDYYGHDMIVFFRDLIIRHIDHMRYLTFASLLSGTSDPLERLIEFSLSRVHASWFREGVKGHPSGDLPSPRAQAVKDGSRLSEEAHSALWLIVKHLAAMQWFTLEDYMGWGHLSGKDDARDVLLELAREDFLDVRESNGATSFKLSLKARLACDRITMNFRDMPACIANPDILAGDILTLCSNFGELNPEELLDMIVMLMKEDKWRDIYFEAMRDVKAGKVWRFMDTSGLESLLDRSGPLDEKRFLYPDELQVGWLAHGGMDAERTVSETDDFREAAELVNKYAQEETELGEEEIKNIHRIISRHLMVRGGLGIRRPVQQGSYRSDDASRDMINYPMAKNIPEAMDAALKLVNSYQFKTMHPVEQAAVAFYIFHNIQPFENGNTRTFSLFMNYMLIRNNYPLLVITGENERSFQSVLRFMRKPESTRMNEGSLALSVFNANTALVLSTDTALRDMRLYARELTTFLAEELALEKNVEIRPAVREDTEAIRALSAINYNEGIIPPREYFERLIGQDGAVTYCYQAAGKIKGCIIALVDSTTKHVSIQQMSAVNDPEKPNIEFALIKAAIEEAEKKGALTFAADVMDGASAAAFTRSGFECILSYEDGGGFFVLDRREKTRTGGDHGGADHDDRPLLADSGVWDAIIFVLADIYNIAAGFWLVWFDRQQPVEYKSRFLLRWPGYVTIAGGIAILACVVYPPLGHMFAGLLDSVYHWVFPNTSAAISSIGLAGTLVMGGLRRTTSSEELSAASGTTHKPSWRKIDWDKDVVKKIMALSHPSIPRLRWNSSKGYYQIRWIYGPRLKEWPRLSSELSDEAFVRQMVSWVIQVGEALMLMHRAGLEHGDVSSDNVVINEDNNEPVLIDFSHSQQPDNETIGYLITSCLQNRIIVKGLADDYEKAWDKMAEVFGSDLVAIAESPYSEGIDLDEFVKRLRDYYDNRWMHGGSFSEGDTNLPETSAGHHAQSAAHDSQPEVIPVSGKDLSIGPVSQAIGISSGFAKEHRLENFTLTEKIGEYATYDGKREVLWKGQNRDNPDKRCIVARSGDAEVAMAAYDILGAEDRYIKLHRIETADGYKEHGIGRCIMGAIFDHAKGLKIQHVSLMCLKEKDEAVKFYHNVASSLHAPVHFGDEPGAVWWNVSYHLSPRSLGFEEASKLGRLRVLSGAAMDRKYEARLNESCVSCKDYNKTGQSLILYADDILDSAAMIDLESTVAKMLVEHKLLDGGKVIVFGRETINAIALEHMIKRAGPDIEVITITQEALGELKPDARKGEIREAKALLEYARTKGAREILAIIRGPVKAPKEFAALAKNSKVPIIQVGVEKAFYSFAQAIAIAIAIKKAEGATGWLWVLPPVQIITKDIEERYQKYRQSLQALAAA